MPTDPAAKLVEQIGVEHALLVADWIGSLMHHQRLFCDEALRNAATAAEPKGK